MATIHINFWKMLGWVCESLQQEDLDACLDFTRMLSYCDDLKELDQIKLIDHFQLGLFLKDAGREGYQAYSLVVSEETAKRHYPYFLRTEIETKVSADILVTDKKIKFDRGNWIPFPFSYDFEKDLVGIKELYLTQ